MRDLDITPAGTGISEPLSENVNLLGALLGQAVREQCGRDALRLVEELRQLCKRAFVERDDTLRRDMGRRAAGIVRDQYCAEKIVPLYEQAYERALQ